MQEFQGDPSLWNDQVSHLPNPHLLQTWEWSQVKSQYGWEPMPFVWYGRPPNVDSQPVAAAMVLKRRIPIRGLGARLNILYIPKGPLMDWGDEPLRTRVLDDLQSFAKRQGAIFLKIDPDVVLGMGVPDREGAVEDNDGQAVMSVLMQRSWLFSSDQIQFRNTVLIDLSPPEEELLARMKQKTRYNIRLAQRKGITVRAGNREDLSLLYKMYAETSVRDGFVIRDENYYETVWQTFMHSSLINRQSSIPCAEPLIAQLDNEPVAAIFVFYFAGRAYYLYGMSRETHREKMPNYLLQWEAMRKAKAARCSVYDLWGAPDEFNEGDSMWGVFRFKEGLGGQVERTLGAWDYTPKPLWYKIYSEVLPRLLDVMRSRRKSRTRQMVT